MGIATDNRQEELALAQARVVAAESEVRRLKLKLSLVELGCMPVEFGHGLLDNREGYAALPENTEGTSYEVFLDMKAQWESSFQRRAAAAARVEPGEVEEE